MVARARLGGRAHLRRRMTGPLVNAPRGEVALTLGSVTHRLCLTLGALAEIETALGLQSLAELETRLKRLSATDILAVLAALLRGGGNPVEQARLAALPLDLGVVTRGLADAFAAAGLGPESRRASPGEARAPRADLPGGAGSPSASDGSL